ncbi:hypothetical protein NEUTE1DRAFT_118086, partial [Neurospora tetrasperma FGSC 2508]
MMRHTSRRLNNTDDGHMWNHQAESKQSEICPAEAHIHLTIITFWKMQSTHRYLWRRLAHEA